MKDGILHTAESPNHKDPWTIMTVYTNGAINDTHRTKLGRINSQRVEPFFENEE